jgi:hypothetical protein
MKSKNKQTEAHPAQAILYTLLNKKIKDRDDSGN